MRDWFFFILNTLSALFSFVNVIAYMVLAAANFFRIFVFMVYGASSLIFEFGASGSIFELRSKRFNIRIRNQWFDIRIKEQVV